MTVYLCTGTDERYYPKIQPYIDTLYKFSPFPVVLFTVGFTERDGKYDDVCYLHIPKDALTDITSNPCIQAGEFLDYSSFLKDDDIVLFTDGDIRLQREFTDSEIEMVKSLPDSVVLAGPNATHNRNTLWDEANGLQRDCANEYLLQTFGAGGVNPIEQTLNMGVIGCTVRTYKDIYRRTYEIFHLFPNVTKHMARQQWYMNLAIRSFCDVRLLPFTFHSHPHNGDQPGMRFGPDGTMYVYGDQKVLFRHKYGIG